MSCRRPTISVRTAVLQRLAQAATRRDAGGPPDSMEFEEVTWEQLERESLVDGINELLGFEDERARSEEQMLALIEEKNARRRQEQAACAYEWEEKVIEKQRAERFEKRLVEERERAREMARAQRENEEAQLHRRLRVVQTENALEEEVVRGRVAQKRRVWQQATRGMLAAAALAAIIGGYSLKTARSAATLELAGMHEEAESIRLSAERRVAELEAELSRATGARGENRELLEQQLSVAQAELIAAQQETEELNRKREQRDTTPPRRLATNPTTPAPHDRADAPARDTGSGVKMATDVVEEANCVAYDPMCFEL